MFNCGMRFSEFRIQKSEVRRLIKKLILLAAMIWLLGSAFAVPAAEISVEASVDRSQVSLGGSIQLNLAFFGTQSFPAPELPEIEGFKSRYLGPSTRMSIVNGRVSSSITHIYTLVPLQAGKFQIGPFSFDYRGETYNAKAISVEVTAGPAPRPGKPEVSPAERPDLGNRVFLTLELKKRKFYLNEFVPLKIKLYVSGLTLRDIQYPEFSPAGFSVDKFAQPRQYRETVGGIDYDVIEFNTTLFATRSGEFILDPAELSCNLVVRKQQRRPRSLFGGFFDEDIFEDFFGRYQTYPLELKSAGLSVGVRDFPEEDRPADFRGAVGDFQFELEAQPREVRVGDPITVRMIVRGEGNFSTVSGLRLPARDEFKAYDPEVRQQEGAKIFEQVLLPKTDEVSEIPAVSFSFFDPEEERYRSLTSGPVAVAVTKPEKEEELKIVEIPGMPPAPPRKEILGRDIVYIKETAGKLQRRGAYLYENKNFLLIHLFPLLIFLGIFGFHKRSEKLRTDIRYARRLAAPRKARKGILQAEKFLRSGKTEQFYDAVFKTLQKYLGDKFHLSSAGITERVVEEVLRPKGISEEILAACEDIFKECNLARYAPGEFGKERMESTARLLEQVIAYLERQRG